MSGFSSDASTANPGSTVGHSDASESIERIIDRFVAFDALLEDLPLYRRLARGCAADREIASLLLAARPGQARPVLLFAAVHDLVLAEPSLALAAWYSSVTDRHELAADDPWPTFRATCLDHVDELHEAIATRATQTNEVNRVAVVAAGVAWSQRDVGDRPITLVELGASAGLLLGFERYRSEIGDSVVGDDSSPVVLRTELRGDLEPDLSAFPLQVIDRVGIDLDPIDLADTAAVRWLEACLWPDQPWRIERFRAAVEVLKADPPRLVRGDAVSLLGEVIDSVAIDTHLVVVDAWALTYVERSRRVEVLDILHEVASTGRPVSWVTMEPPGCVPGIDAPALATALGDTVPDTVVGVHRWRDGHAVGATTLGWSHPHGSWLALTPDP